MQTKYAMLSDNIFNNPKVLIKVFTNKGRQIFNRRIKHTYRKILHKNTQIKREKKVPGSGPGQIPNYSIVSVQAGGDKI